MSLDIYLEVVKPCEVFSANYTHNVGTMASHAGLYEPLWHPEKIGIERADQLIPWLESGIEKMKADPDKFIALNSGNGWGSYETFLPWLEKLLEACKENTGATVRVWT